MSPTQAGVTGRAGGGDAGGPRRCRQKTRPCLQTGRPRRNWPLCSSRQGWSSAPPRTAFRRGDCARGNTCRVSARNLGPRAVDTAPSARPWPGRGPRRGSLGDPFSTSEGLSANCLGLLTAALRTESVPKHSHLKQRAENTHAQQLFYLETRKQRCRLRKWSIPAHKQGRGVRIHTLPPFVPPVPMET